VAGNSKGELLLWAFQDGSKPIKLEHVALRAKVGCPHPGRARRGGAEEWVLMTLGCGTACVCALNGTGC